MDKLNNKATALSMGASVDLGDYHLDLGIILKNVNFRCLGCNKGE